MLVLLLQVLSLVALISGSVYSSNNAVADAGDSRNAVGGWIGFVAFVVMLVELGVIAARFINFAFVYQYPLVMMIAVSCWCAESCTYDACRGRDHVLQLKVLEWLLSVLYILLIEFGVSVAIDLCVSMPRCDVCYKVGVTCVASIIVWCHVLFAQDVVFCGVSAVGIGIGFIVTAANAANFQSKGNGPPRDAAAATSVSASVLYVIRYGVTLLHVCIQIGYICECV